MLGNDLAVVDTRTLKVVRRIPLGATTRKDPDLLGRYLFTTATIVKGEQFSCNSCHPDGSMDGISWKFVHVPDALGKETDRNAKDLRGHIGESAPYRWSGHERNLEGFVEEEIHGLLQGNKLTPAEVRAMAHYIGSLPLPPNPYRAPNGSLTDAAQRGKALFEGSAGCISCHSGPKAGGQRKAWVGTTPDGIELQVPRLQGVYDSAPYLHDGKARTLEEIFTRCNTKQAHGKAHDLSPEEMKDLLRYVREL
jgi:cytochrome c peroxidase